MGSAIFEICFRGLVNGNLGHGAQLAADGVGGEARAEEAAVEGSRAALVERATKGFQAAREAGAHDCAFIGLGGALGEGGFNVAVRNSAGAEVARDAKRALLAYFCVLTHKLPG